MPVMTKDIKYLIISQLADCLQVSKWSFYRYVKTLRIPHFKVGRHLRFDQFEIDSWLRINNQIPKKTGKTDQR